MSIYIADEVLRKLRIDVAILLVTAVVICGDFAESTHFVNISGLVVLNDSKEVPQKKRHIMINISQLNSRIVQKLQIMNNR